MKMGSVSCESVSLVNRSKTHGFQQDDFTCDVVFFSIAGNTFLTNAFNLSGPVFQCLSLG